MENCIMKTNQTHILLKKRKNYNGNKYYVIFSCNTNILNLNF